MTPDTKRASLRDLLDAHESVQQLRTEWLLAKDRGAQPEQVARAAYERGLHVFADVMKAVSA